MLASAIFLRTELVGGGAIEASVGNGGRTANAERFDARVEVRKEGNLICGQSTNFVTPLDPGMVVRAFRVDFDRAPADAGRVRHTVRFSIHFLDGDRKASGDHERILTWDVPQGAGVRCVALKPPQ